jgi:HEPN domain-containing protein
LSGRPETYDAAARWLRWANEDLAHGEYGFGNERLVARGACVWAHQAGEKAVKALLIVHDIDPPKRHDLDLLCQLLPPDDGRLLSALNLPELSRWAIEGRYPDDFDEASRSQAAQALELARGDHRRR